ncbi:MAG: hypothetical protein IKD23_02000 [Lentisphaeria bacterium]|nr:hypothetical protein [Lentisphaeria bacterium]
MKKIRTFFRGKMLFRKCFLGAAMMIKLNFLFQDGMVLQQNAPVPVWGSAAPEALIEVSIAGKSACTRASTTGEFMVKLPELPAGGPFEMVIKDCGCGEKIVLKDVLVGEVWLASGQSNMQYFLGADWRPVKNGEYSTQLAARQLKEFAAETENLDKFRFIKITESFGAVPEKQSSGTWQPMKFPDAANASAAAAWFALQLRKNLNVPVGIIVSAYGGTLIESWTSRNGLANEETMADAIAEYEKNLQQRSVWEDKVLPPNNASLKYAVPDKGNEGIHCGWAKAEYNDSMWKKMEIPGSWLTQEICGNGAVWFRKEVEIPASAAGKELFLEIPGIDKQDVTYFNGVEIGRTGSGLDISTWNTFRRYRIAPELVKPGKNLIAIRAYSFSSNGGFFGSADQHRLLAADNSFSLPLAGTWKAKAELDLGIIPSLPPYYPLHPKYVNAPGNIFNKMINPLIPFAIKGVIWYQGESNASSVDEAQLYRKKFAAMVRDWRYRWGQRQLPFIQVQLAGFNHINHQQPWADLREAQRLVCRDLPQVYMVSAIDIGEADDIHPQNKKEVGSRLAAGALHHIYLQYSQVPGGPLFDSCFRQGNMMAVKFTYADGLTLRGEHPEKAFEIAGNDGVFHPADKAEIRNGGLYLSAETVERPCFVRYAWRNFPLNVLYNSSNFPASSFDSRNK